MSVDLEELVEALKAEMSPPGTNLFPDATQTELVQRLQNAFWEARINGAFPTYREAEGIISPISGDEDLPRELQQLIVLYAAYNVVLTALRNVQSSFRAKAGPVEYETAQSAILLREVLRAIQGRLGAALDAAINGVPGAAGNTAVFDAVIYRTDAIRSGEGWWVR